MDKKKHRIQEIYEELARSQRWFAKSIGLQPTSLAAIIGNRSGVTQVLANSIELKHGYSAEWILTGEGDKKAEVTSQDELYNNMLVCAVEGLYGEEHLGNFVEKGLMRRIENDIAEKQIEYIGKIKKSGLKDTEIYSNIGHRTEEVISQKKKIDKVIEEAAEKLVGRGFVAFLFRIYMEVIEENLIDIDIEDFDLSDYAYKTHYIKQVKKIIKQIEKLYEIWNIPDEF